MTRHSGVTRVVAAVAGVLILAAVALVLYMGVSASTPPLRDADGNVIPGSIAVLESVELGGLEQWILIRGQDRSKPILLWLHGGPGGAQMPFAHRVDPPLEEHLVVVHWDQRGAGKSNHRGFDEATMRLDRYLEDARELIHHLRQRLGQDRIFLLGHSWGTRLGMELVQAHPELFHAYIGVSQVVDHERAAELAHAWLLQVVDSARAPGDWRTLREIEIPARRHPDFRELIRLTTEYGGSLDLSFTQLARIAVRSPEYSFLDYFRLLDGMQRGGGPMHAGGVIESYDFTRSIPAVEVPVYFFIGAHDYNTPRALVEEYFETLDAPHKELAVFEHSAHLPFFAEREKFAAELVRVADDVSRRHGTSRAKARSEGGRIAGLPHRVQPGGIGARRSGDARRRRRLRPAGDARGAPGVRMGGRRMLLSALPGLPAGLKADLELDARSMYNKTVQ